MNGLALLGILLIIYGACVIFITMKKPASIWNMVKIRMFRKLLGEKGTVILFYIIALIAVAVGVWLMIK